MKKLQDKIDIVKRLFKFLDPPEMSAGGPCPGPCQGENERLIINGKEYLCPACETARHNSASLEADQGGEEAGPAAPSPQYKD